MTVKGIGKEKAMEKGLVFACCPGCAWLQKFRAGHPTMKGREGRALGNQSSLAWVLTSPSASMPPASLTDSLFLQEKSSDPLCLSLLVTCQTLTVR